MCLRDGTNTGDEKVPQGFRSNISHSVTLRNQSVPHEIKMSDGRGVCVRERRGLQLIPADCPQGTAVLRLTL